MYPAVLYRDMWTQHHNEPVVYGGVACCIFVEEFGQGEIRVELSPEDEATGDQWPVDVLHLTFGKQQEIVDQFR